MMRYQKNGKKYMASLVSSHQEVCERMSDLIKKLDLENRPLFITGFFCVGMGQTLTHSNYGSFTHSIISHLSCSPVVLYQLIGRITGRMKHWEKYQQTKLLCPSSVYATALNMEKKVREILKSIEIEASQLE
jgi:hypothetical protein